MKRLNRPLLEAAARLVIAWLAMSALCMGYGREMVDALSYFLTIVTESISDDFSVVLGWKADKPSMLEVVATFLALKPELAALGVQPASSVTTATNVEHVLVPVVLLFTALSGWPVRRFWHRLVLLALGVPAALVALALTTPFLLAGKVEIVLQQRAAQLGVAREEPFFLTWMLFTEGGGRWVIPIVLAFACIWLGHDLLRRFGRGAAIAS